MELFSYIWSLNLAVLRVQQLLCLYIHLEFQGENSEGKDFVNISEFLL